MHLVAVAARRCRPVVADRDRQEVEHEVRVGDGVVAPGEATRLEVIGCSGPASTEEPVRPDDGPSPPTQLRLQGHRLRARVLHVDLEVVLEVLAHAGQVPDHGNAQRLELGGVAHTGELQQLRRVDRAAAEDDLAGHDPPHSPPTAPVLDAASALAVEEDFGGEGARADGQVRPCHGRVQVGLRRAPASTAVDVPVEACEALLTSAVHVVGEREPGLLHRFEERAEQRVRRRATLQEERTVAAPVLVGPLPAGLHALEVGQAVGEVPGRHPRVGGPPLVVHRVAPLEDHAVDAAGPAQHLASGVGDPSVVHEGLGLGLVAPVVEAVADRERQGGRHVDVHVPPRIGAAGLQHQHPVGGVGAEPGGERVTGRAPSDDDEVVLLRGHAFLRAGCRTCSLQPARDPTSASRHRGRARP